MELDYPVRAPRRLMLRNEYEKSQSLKISSPCMVSQAWNKLRLYCFAIAK
jgi:hypothetical protein